MMRDGACRFTIARLESSQTLPSAKTLLRYAEETDSKFHVRLSAACGGIRPRQGMKSRKIVKRRPVWNSKH